MSRPDLFYRAHQLALRHDQQVILLDLPLLSELELTGVIAFLNARHDWG